MAGSGSMTEGGNRGQPGISPGSAPRHSKSALSKSLTFESYVSSGVVEVPEMEIPAHVLILRTGSSSVIEWRTDGRERRATLPPGSMSLLPAGFWEAARVTRPMPGVASILQIRPSFFERALGEIARGGRIELTKQMQLNDSQISRLMETLREEIAAGSPAGTLFHESVALALSAHIAQRYSTSTIKVEPYRGGLSRLRLNRVLEFINANLSDNLELGVLAEVAGLNLHHFARAFKQSIGETPHQYVLRTRIERAMEFLRHPQASVVEASARTGFVDQSHFSKVFRRIVGVAPSEFRTNA